MASHVPLLKIKLQLSFLVLFVFLGENGDKGVGGGVGLPGAPPRPQGFIVVRHSQSRNVPQCSAGMTTLWSGYSLLYTEGNERAQHQDLGNLKCLSINSPEDGQSILIELSSRKPVFLRATFTNLILIII